MPDIRYRRSPLDLRLSLVQDTAEAEILALHGYVSSRNLAAAAEAELSDKRLCILSDAVAQRGTALHAYITEFWRPDDRIPPIRGSLAAWGLTINDVAVASFHGPSTVKGDENEPEVISKQLRHLGRSSGNVFLGVFQKHLTGHPKATAGAWMLNSCLQMLHSGVVPGGRNVDNIDSVF
ncbi:hypothetical protein B0J12DRAFT_571481 [Macrophomina phaseolina]|uniref:Beta-ketoacyl synthase C-terminal domain-containing protein n=1 Tax=Macrophomina phaseolina TaxID=35725 RepID=A0ABQ8GEQ4_9PEZI|nr:hypothetical protein B0J12DRAFT_571481 [Macrophomina phaseolina]